MNIKDLKAKLTELEIEFPEDAKKADLEALLPEGFDKSEEPEFPVVEGNGRFQMVAVEGGFVVYNPVGQRATGIVAEEFAKNQVLKNNQAIGIVG